MDDFLDITVFESGQKYVSLGKIDSSIVDFLTEKVPSLAGILNSDTDILFWKDRIKHTELHKNDFISDNEFYTCLEMIPSIIKNPDYLSVHKKDNSISFIKDFSSHISVAIRISPTGGLSYRTMYPLMDVQLSNYIDNGTAWKWTSHKNLDI